MYVKLFTSIYQGTLRGRSNELLVFTNLLAHADMHGHVDIHPSAIADEVGLTKEQVRDALIELEAPDVESRSPENEGRRIIRLDDHRDWGWRIVNYVKYRTIKNDDDRREQNRIAQAKWRDKHKQDVSTVSTDKQRKPMQMQMQKQIQKQENTGRTAAASRLPKDFCPDMTIAEREGITDIQREFESFTDYWTAKAGKDGTKLDWQATWRNWCRNSKNKRINGRQPETFKERDARNTRKRWSEMTGEVHPDSDPEDILRIAP